METDVGTVAPGSTVELEVRVTVVAAEAAELSVAVQVNCSPGSS